MVNEEGRHEGEATKRRSDEATKGKGGRLRRGQVAALGVVGMCLWWGGHARVVAEDGAAPVRLSARDLDGNAVAIPTPGRATLIVFVMAGQGRSLAAMAQAREVVGDGAECRTLAVVSGAGAQVGARAVRDAAEGWALPIVLDPDYEISGALVIHAWPSTVLLDDLGHLQARIPGLPASFAKDLEAHLDAVAGRIDAARLRERLASHDMVASTSKHIAVRHLQVARRLMERRQVEPARLELQKALAIEPEDARLRLAMAEVHVMAGDASSALGVLDGMDASQAPAWQLETLRGRALVALGRWEEARATLDEALKLNPDPARAHYFLGRVLAHQGEWPGAAKHYRAAFEHAPAAGALATHELADGGRQE